MPNLIHSLDATSIAMLYTDFKGPIYSVPDGFAVTSNNVPKLVNCLKWVYMKLYSNECYLLQFDKILRLNINSSFGDKTFKKDDSVVNIFEKDQIIQLKYPEVNKIVNLNVHNKISSLEHSSYIII